MNEWKQNLKKSNLTLEELRKIPGTSCESVSYLVDFAQRELDIPTDKLLEGLSVGLDHLLNTDLWIDPVDDLRLQKNILRYSRSFLSHKAYLEIGKNFGFSKNSNLALLYRLSSPGLVFKNIQKNLDRFNSYTLARTLEYGKGRALIALEFHEFYKSIADGTTSFLTEGVFYSNFVKHGIKQYTSKHHMVGIPLEGILKNCFGHLNWKVELGGDKVYVNDIQLAERVILKPVLINNHTSFSYVEGYQGEGPVAHRITEDFYWKGNLVFLEGELYGAPFSLIEFSWKEPWTGKNVFQAFLRQKMITQALEELERGISRANERYFEAAEALRSNRHQSQILQVYTKRILSERALAGDDPTKWHPRKRQVAVLFCDIRGFTNLSERLSAEEIVSFLNDFFGRMNGLITIKGGEIDKLMGDSVMAQFSDADAAVDAALEMNLELQNMNRERFAAGKPRVDIGIGVSWGDVIQGNIGTADRMDYTIVGDTVNVASRLESLTKHYQVLCIISQDVLNRLSIPMKTRFLDKVQVKGKIQPVSIYEVFESDPDWLQTIKTTIQPLYDLAYKVYETGDFSRAVSLYAKIYREIGPHSLETALSADPVVLFYMDRARELRDAVEDGEFDLSRWSGVYKFQTG